METLKQAVEVIRDAERKLCSLLGTAGVEGEYNALITMADWAKQLSYMASSIPGSWEALKEKATVGPEYPVNPGKSVFTAPPENEGGVKSTRQNGLKGGRQKIKGREYPRFVKNNEDLIKIGWSKKERSEYEHKAPKVVIDILAKALMKVGERGRHFPMENLLPLRQVDSSEVPSYQAYLALAWLRSENLVVQHGRQGYSLQEGLDLLQEIQKRWIGIQNR